MCDHIMFILDLLSAHLPNVAPLHLDVLVPVRPALLVFEPQGVHQLVDDDAEELCAGRVEEQEVPPSLPAHVAAAAETLQEAKKMSS